MNIQFIVYDSLTNKEIYKKSVYAETFRQLHQFTRDLIQSQDLRDGENHVQVIIDGHPSYIIYEFL